MGNNGAEIDRYSHIVELGKAWVLFVILVFTLLSYKIMKLKGMRWGKRVDDSDYR